MVFGWFKRKVINTISSKTEMQGLLTHLKNDKAELESEIEKIETQITTVTKMIEAMDS